MQHLTETGGLTCGPGDRTNSERPSLAGGAHGGGGLISQYFCTVGCVLTTEGLLIELHKVCEDVFRDGLLVR